MRQINFDDKTIAELSLTKAFKPINAHLASDARIFQMAELEDIYIMESDLYGNVMPSGSCFLAFNGRNGLMGKHMLIETLKKSSIANIRRIVDDNNSG